MSNIEEISVVRDRGQLTIPNVIRATVNWLRPSAVVRIKTSKPNEIIIHPHHQETKTEWEEIWDSIHLARSFTGKRGRLSKFIEQERQQH